MSKYWYSVKKLKEVMGMDCAGVYEEIPLYDGPCRDAAMQDYKSAELSGKDFVRMKVSTVRKGQVITVSMSERYNIKR